MEVVKKEFGPQIHQMICTKGFFFSTKKNILFDKVCREIAYARLKNTGFGGSERKIHTERHEEHKDKIFTVIDIKFCKTGIYYSPSGGGSYYDEYDSYEPGGLDNEKTHKILYLSPAVLSLISKHHLRAMDDLLMIEATNVEKVIKTP